MIEHEMKYIEDLKLEMFKVREELKVKVNNIENDKDGIKNENFLMKQNIDKLKHDLLIQLNENTNLKCDIDSFKAKTNQLNLIIENKEKAYLRYK